MGEREVAPCVLQVSPLVDSTLITSAHHSAKILAVIGPASILESSITLIPSIGFMSGFLLRIVIELITKAEKYKVRL